MIPGLGSTRLTEQEVASAATITVKADLIRITGTTQIDNILGPPTLVGRDANLIFMYTTGAGVVVSAAGNVAVSQTLATNRLYAYVWSYLANKWLPHAIN